jgi:hypothetical protein
MRFADDGARGSALGTAVGTAVPLAEGMVAYLDDINQIQVYSGSSWTSPLPGIGSNVVQTVKLNTFTTSSTSFTTVEGLTATITPSSATAKVLVIAQLTIGLGNNSGVGHFRFAGGNSGTYIGAEAGSRVRAVFGGGIEGNASSLILAQSMVYLDSPGSASPVTYSVEARQAVSGTVRVNVSVTDSNNVGFTRGASSITAIEVAV